jgi:hypothetical protein
MRQVQVLSLLFALAGCGAQGGREIHGVAPEGVSDIYAMDTQGRTAHADATSGEFSVALEPGAPAVLFFQREDGVVAPLVFDDGHGGTQSVIPDFEGTVELGQVSIVDRTAARDGEGDVTAESEENPLDDVDSDDDGESDSEDEDDDDDGVEDESDDDDDGDGEDDDESDLDEDDDGDPDESDDDDDNDGVDDEEDEDSEDDA